MSLDYYHLLHTVYFDIFPIDSKKEHQYFYLAIKSPHYAQVLLEHNHGRRQMSLHKSTIVTSNLFTNYDGCTQFSCYQKCKGI